jgi:hypothetical protein
MMDWNTLSPEERLIAEQAILNLRELNKACDEAPDGKVFAIAETMAMNQGRALIRKTLESSLAHQATHVEKKRAQPEHAPATEHENIAENDDEN